MCGPMGVGVLWARRALLEAMPPYQFGSNMAHDVGVDSAALSDAALKFGAGTPNVSGAVGLAAAADFLSALGRAQTWAHEQSITRHFLDRVRGIRGVRVSARRRVGSSRRLLVHGRRYDSAGRRHRARRARHRRARRRSGVPPAARTIRPAWRRSSVVLLLHDAGGSRPVRRRAGFDRRESKMSSPYSPRGLHEHYNEHSHRSRRDSGRHCRLRAGSGPPNNRIDGRAPRPRSGERVFRRPAT